MTALDAVPARSPDDDPDLPTGLALVSFTRKRRIIQAAKIGVVWVGLLAFLGVGLLQLNFDPTYAFQHYNFVLEGSVDNHRYLVCSHLSRFNPGATGGDWAAFEQRHCPGRKWFLCINLSRHPPC